MKTRFLTALLVALLAACAPARRLPEEPVPPIQRNWSSAALADLILAAEAAPSEGLPAETSALAELERYERSADIDATAAAQLDVAADALFASLARSLSQGAVDPATADPTWRMPPPAAPHIPALLARRAAGESPSALLRGLAPQSPDYALLREELARLLQVAEADAEGPSRASRIRSLRASLERMRWLPRDLPATRVEVQVPHFQVVFVSDGTPLRAHAAIVGARNSPTPSFAAQIRSVTLNPYWDPPLSIVTAELLPRFRRNPAAAARENYEVLDAAGREVPLAQVDWNARPFPYRLRQRPGSGNALGRLRLDLPNPHAIFLHDTPSRGLFARADRALSHGCVRVQDPVDLAAAILGEAWSAAALSHEIENGATTSISLTEAVPVYFLYLTAVRSSSGALLYADDIYGLDERVVAALDAPEVSLLSHRASLPARCQG